MEKTLQTTGQMLEKTPEGSVLKELSAEPEAGFRGLLMKEPPQTFEVEGFRNKLWISVPLVPTFVRRKVVGYSQEAKLLDPYSITVTPPNSGTKASFQSETIALHIYLENDLIMDMADSRGERFHPGSLGPAFGLSDVRLASVVQHMIYEMFNPDEARSIGMEYHVSNVASLVLERLPSHSFGFSRYERDGLSSVQLKRVLDYIEANISSKIGVQQLADLVSLSRSNFMKRFKISTAFTPHQYVMRLRVCRAKHMIRSHRLELADIAVSCGFSDQAHFSNVFSRLEGITPLQYHRLHR